MKRSFQDEMELVSGLLRGWKGWSRRNEIGAGNRVSAREGTTLAVGLYPAYELNEQTRATGSGEERTGLGSGDSEVKRMCRIDWVKGITTLAIFRT